VLAALLVVWIAARYGLALVEFLWQEGSWPAWVGALVLLVLCMAVGFFPYAALTIFVILVILAIVLTATRRHITAS
jgi:hypothetical protein